MKSHSKRHLLINDLLRHTKSLRPKMNQAIRRVLNRGRFINGAEVEAFEQEFADYCGTRYCVGVANGTDALEVALRALRVGSGDQVVTVANAGSFARTAIRAVGAEPCYVDVEPETLCMDARELSRRITKKTRAVIVTHLYGKMAAMPEILHVTRKAGIPVVEDCAQAHGAVLNGRKAGKWGVLGCFSFYPTKNLGAVGDGGAIVTDDKKLSGDLRLLKNYGLAGGRVVCEGGQNSRLDEMQAAVLRVKLPYLDRWNKRRREIASVYSEAFKRSGILCPQSFGADYVAHLYVIRTPQRDSLRDHLATKGIDALIHYELPDHQQPAIQFLNFSKSYLPTTKKCCETVISLPCFPELTSAEIARVISTVSSFMGALKT